MLGIGLDVVEVARWRRLLERHGERILLRLFSAEERAQCGGLRAAEHLAGRWAAKEAVAKALGCRAGPWRDVVILRGAGGAPRVVLRGAWEQAARARGIAAIRVSLTHEALVAAAVAAALPDSPGGPVGVRDQRGGA